MSGAKIIDLGQQGANYVRAHLEGANALSAFLLEAVASQPGTTFTVLPAETRTEHAFCFEQGGLLLAVDAPARRSLFADGQPTVQISMVMQEQLNVLREALRRTPNAVCVVDDFNPRWSELDKDFWPLAFGVGEEVYHRLTRDDDDDAFVLALQAGNTIWHGVAAVCAGDVEFDDSRIALLADLQKCAAAVNLLTCTAYDGEGFVVWRRRSGDEAC